MGKQLALIWLDQQHPLLATSDTVKVGAAYGSRWRRGLANNQTHLHPFTTSRAGLPSLTFSAACVPDHAVVRATICGLACIERAIAHTSRARSNPTRLRFSQRRFFGTSTSLSFFQPPWESRKVEHKQKGNDGGRPPTHPWVRVLYEKPPNSWDSQLCNRPALAVSSQPFGVIGGRQGLLPLRCRRSPSYCCTRLFDDPAGVTVRPASSSPDTSIRVRRPIGGADREHWSRGLRSVVEEVLEEVLFDAEAGVRYVITDKTVRGGEAVKQSMSQSRAPLSYHLLRRFRVSKTVESSGLRRG